MCNYVKENWEQCGMDEEPYCRHHDDTIQAALYEKTADRFGHDLEPKVLGTMWRAIEDSIEAKEDEICAAVEEATDGAVSDSSGIVMDTTCDDCDTPLRRTERLGEHPNMNHRLVFEAVIECDCSEHVLGSTSERVTNLPEGWS